MICLIIICMFFCMLKTKQLWKQQLVRKRSPRSPRGHAKACGASSSGGLSDRSGCVSAPR